MSSLSVMKRSNRAFEVLRAAAIVFLAAGLPLYSAMLKAAEKGKTGLPTFDLADQFGMRYTETAWAGEAVILVGGDRAGRQESREWAIALRDWLADRPTMSVPVSVVRLADLRGVPGFLKGRVTKEIRKTIGSPLLLDWQGTLADHFGLQAGVANVLVLDTTGSLVWRLESSAASAEELSALRGILEELEISVTHAAEANKPTTLLGSFL